MALMQVPQSMDPLKLGRRQLPPPSLSRRKRPSDDELSPEHRPIAGGWVEETDPNAKYLFRYDPMAKRAEGDPGSDEGVLIEPSGRRVERKDRKNKREQERRKEINDRFALLSDLLFGSKFSGRVDKTQILDRAIDLVRNGPSILRSPENLALDPSQDDTATQPRETWQQQGEFSSTNGCAAGEIREMNKTPMVHGGRYRESCPGPHCHGELSMESRDMGHSKYVQTQYQPYPNFAPNGHSMGFASSYPPTPNFFPSQYPPHSSYPPVMMSDAPAHFSVSNRPRGRCLDCESDGSGSPERRSNFRSLGSSSGTCRKNGSTICSSISSWGHGGNCGSRKDFQVNDEDSPEDAPELADLASVSQSQLAVVTAATTNTSTTSSSAASSPANEGGGTNSVTRRQTRFGSNGNNYAATTTTPTTDSSDSPTLAPNTRSKVAFDSKANTELGANVALLDTLVQLSQNPKRAKK